MIDALLILLTLGSAALVIYHHAVYPLMLAKLQAKREQVPPESTERRYSVSSDDPNLPRIGIVIPAYNEAEWVYAKIQNLAFLDYPQDKLQVILACDGCTDDTAAIARACMNLPECADLNLEVREFHKNRGKVAVINDVVPTVRADLVVMSDVSAIVSMDALLIAAAHFKDRQVGVLNSHYRIYTPGSQGEAQYWNYQSRIKASEASLGATMGAHGAFYVFRRELFFPLAPNIINDDFVLPMQIVSRGFKAKHDNRILALELEQADLGTDQRRRERISQGNLQQVLHLKHMLRPRYRGVAFAFASGKALRVVMPHLMLISLIGSWLLFDLHALFALMAIGQTLLYSIALWAMRQGERCSIKPLKTLGYILSGHIAGFTGSLNYLFKRNQGPWRRANAERVDNSSNGMP